MNDWDTGCLYHYYERSVGPFVSLSNLPLEDSQRIQDRLRQEGKVFAAQRNAHYLERHRYLEQQVRSLFAGKGGKPVRATPHYMVIGRCRWLESWFRDTGVVRISIGHFDLDTVSFTYGDTFPTFSPHVTDGMEYRQTVYTYPEILGIIAKYGLPQENWSAPIFAQPCYVEAQVWSDFPIERYRL